MYLLSVRHTNFRKLYIQLSPATCFGRVWTFSGRFYDSIHGKKIPSWRSPLSWPPFTVKWGTERGDLRVGIFFHVCCRKIHPAINTDIWSNKLVAVSFESPFFSTSFKMPFMVSLVCKEITWILYFTRQTCASRTNYVRHTHAVCDLRCAHPYSISVTVVLQMEGSTPLVLKPCIVQILKHFRLHKPTLSNCKLIFKIPSRYSYSAISERLLAMFLNNFISKCNNFHVTN